MAESICGPLKNLICVVLLLLVYLVESADALTVYLTKAQMLEETARKDSCAVFSATVKLEARESCVVCNHEVCIVEKYWGEGTQSRPYSNGYALYGHEGNVIKQFEYERLKFSNELSGALLLAKKNGRYGFINSHGDTITDFKYWEAYDFSDGLACVQEESPYSGEQSCAYINAKGEIVIAPGQWLESGKFSDGLAFVKNSSGKYGYINTKGEVVLPFKYDDFDYFTAGRLLVETEDGYGYINKQGEVVIAPQYQAAWSFDDSGVAAVKGPNGWGYIDVDGLPVTDLTYQSVDTELVDGLAEVRIGNCNRSEVDGATQACRKGLVAPSGHYILPVEFQHIELRRWKDQKVIVASVALGKDFYQCLYDYLGVRLADCSYKIVYTERNLIEAVQTRESSDVHSIKKNQDTIGLRGVFDFSGKVIVPFEYRSIFLKDGVILAENSLQKVTFDYLGNVLKTQHFPQGQRAYAVLADDNSKPKILGLYSEDAYGNEFTRNTVAEGEELHLFVLANKAADGKKADLDLGLSPEVACQYRFVDESLVLEDGILKGVVVNGDSYDPDDSARILNNKTHIVLVGTGVKDCSPSR